MLRQAHIAVFFACLFLLPLCGCWITQNTAQDSPGIRAESEDCAQPSQKGRSWVAPPLDSTLDIRIVQEPTSLLPQVDPSRACRSVVLHQVIETLLRREDTPGGLSPALAVAVEVSEDRLTYVFRLDPDAYWSDGRPVTAGDVVHTLSRLIDPAEVLWPRLSELGVVEVRALDAHTVLLHLVSPSSELLRMLAEVPILAAHQFDLIDLARSKTARGPIGSGPYLVVSWVSGQRITLRRNPRWRGTPASFETVVFHIVPDDRVAVELFDSGKLDIVTGMVRRPRQDSMAAHFRSYDVPEVAVLLYNRGRPATADPSVRLALSRLVDRPTLSCRILDGLARIEEIPWLSITRTAPHRFDPEAAAKSLEGAGWRLSTTQGIRRRAGVPLRLRLLVSDERAGFERAWAMLVQDAAKAGIDLDIERQARGAMVERLSRHDFDFAVVVLDEERLANPHRFLGSGSQVEPLVADTFDLEAQSIFAQLAASSDEANRLALGARLAEYFQSREPLTFLYGRQEGALVHPALAPPVFDHGRLDIAMVRPHGSRRER
jgi:peptide/nickel transport system substrate-binding protein